MKLRLISNALRLRLSQSDVAAFRATGRVTQTLDFPGATTLTWALEASPDVTEPDARYSAEGIRVLVPAAQSTAWADSAEVGLYSAPGAPGPAIAIEKDFKCLHETPHRQGDNRDSFPNPAA